MRGRGGIMKQKPRDKALLRLNIVKVEQKNSARRLQKDLKELEDSKIPLVGVSARPLSSSMYIWHGNLRGPEGTPFEGGVFHIELTFPIDYPCSPPTIRLFTPLPHPNVLGQYSICLDILDIKQKKIYQGWTSAYTVETVLIQLQSFLFEELPADILKASQVNCKDAIRLANSFICPHKECGHQGPLKPWPAFSNKEKDLGAFILLDKTPDDLLHEELQCFHTKMKLRDTSLGIGVSISRLPRTGEIRMITPTLDLLSMRAFIKQKVRHSLSNEKFTHWLPLYFGEKDVFETKITVKDGKKEELKTVMVNTQERQLKLLKKSISFICKGSTRKPFQGNMINQVMPKLIITHLVSLVQDFRHFSILAIRRLVNFVRLYRLLLDLHPEIDQENDQKIEEFIKNPEKRHKDHTSSLGDLLSMVTVSKKFKIEDIIPAYLEEQLDRQIFWILREIPELDHTDEKYKDKDVVVEEAKSEICFKTGMDGFHITLFFFYFNKMVIEKGGKDLDKLVKYLDCHYGCLEEREEDFFQRRCFAIQDVKSFQKYYPMLGIPIPDDNSLRERIKQAIENSRKKKYHGNSSDMNTLPKINEQAIELLEDKVKPFEYYDEATKQLLPAEDPKWKKAVMEKFSWIKQIDSNSASDEKLVPKDYALMNDEDTIKQKEDFIIIKQENDKLRQYISLVNNGYLKQTVQQNTIVQDYPENFNWRDLFVKLCFEQMLQYFPQHQDFKLFYKYIDVFGPHLHTLRIKILDKKNFKSNNYYLMALVGRLNHVKILKFHKDLMTHLSVDGFKYLQKGFKYLQDNGGSLSKLQINNILGNTSEEYLYQCLKAIPELRVLKVNDVYLSVRDAQTIGKVLSDFKQIQELDMTNCALDPTKAKEIADGLMRAKQLQILKIGKNNGIGKGADSILYNLAFSPKITHIDLSDNYLNTADTAENVYKLIKISGSLETLILKNTQINNNLQEVFFKAIGENKTLTYLNLDSTTYTNLNILQLLGKACGMNHKKNGSLKVLSLVYGFTNYNAFSQFLESFKISDHDHEIWYGDKKIAKDMSKDQLEKKFEFGLENLNLNNSILSGNYFKFKELSKRKEPQWPVFMQMLTKLTLENLNLQNCQLQKNDMELISYSLYNNPYGISNIKVLNLSRNPIMKEGAKTLAGALEGNTTLQYLDLSQCQLGVAGTYNIAKALYKNTSLKHLNLYRNKVDVDGARSLRELLKVNNTLEFLDVGFNRLREKGIKALTDGIIQNPNSNLKYLGLRFNFINDDGFLYFFENTIIKNKSKIDHVYLLQNYLSEHCLISIQQKIEQTGRQMYVDGFEKLQYLNQDKLDKSIWISPLVVGRGNQGPSLWKFFQSDFECGLISDIRIRKGQKIAGKPKDNCYAIIEYVHANSIPRSLRVASKKKSVLQGNRFRIYKAGTRTVVFVRPQKRKQ